MNLILLFHSTRSQPRYLLIRLELVLDLIEVFSSTVLRSFPFLTTKKSTTNLTNNSLPFQNNVCKAAQRSPPQTVLTKLSWRPTLCAAWIGMHRQVTSRNQGTFSRYREDPGNEVWAMINKARKHQMPFCLIKKTSFIPRGGFRNS